MQSIKKFNVETLFKGILNNLVKRNDGVYAFKNGGFQYTIRGYYGEYIERDIVCFPSTEELCDFFEKEIVKLVPHAKMIINNDFTITIDIDPKNAILKQFFDAKKELHLLDVLKTLFFPTTKESIFKDGHHTPEYIYNPNQEYEAIYTPRIIKFKTPIYTIMRGIEGSALDFLQNDIKFYLTNFKFKNPIPLNIINLPKKDIKKEDLFKKENRKKKVIHIAEEYSYEQKIRFMEKLIQDFLIFYPKMIEDNFPNIKNRFFLYSNLPIKVSLYTMKHSNEIYDFEDVSCHFIYEKLEKGEENQFELYEQQELESSPECLKDIEYFHWDSFLSLSELREDIIKPDLLTSKLYGLNALPFTYEIIGEEISDINDNIRTDSFLEDLRPFESSAGNWLQMIIDAKEKGGETYHIELKSIPTESTDKDGSGNCIYGHINAFENTEGGHIFIGVDESKYGEDMIVGLENYLNNNNTTLDQLVREIRQKCFNYFGNNDYRIESRSFKGKSLVRIKVHPNYRNLTWFRVRPKEGKSYRVAYKRQNREKIQMTDEEIEERIRKTIIL